MKNFSIELDSEPKGSLVGQKRKKSKKLIYSGSVAVNMRRRSLEDLVPSQEAAHQPFRPVNSSAFQENEATSGEIKAKLPKLYSAGLYKNFNSKMQSLKDKYSHLYNQFGKNGNQQNSSIRQMMKESEQLFSRTYSIKYFGVNNDQIGILSRRIPLKQPDNNRLSPTALTKQILKTQSNKETQEKQTEPSLADIMKKNVKRNLEENNKNLESSKGRSKTPDPSTKMEFVEESSPNIEKTGENPIITQVEVEQGALEADDKEIEAKAQEFVPVPQKYDVYVVNKYFIPKHLHAAKRQQKRSQSAGNIGLFGEVGTSRSQTAQRNRRLGSIQHRRDVSDVSKVRQTLMRSMSNFHPSTEPPTDRVLESDRYMTHELKMLISDKTNFSYAKLLSTIQNPDLIHRMNQRREMLNEFLNKRQERIENIHGNGAIPSRTKSEKFYKTSGQFFVQITRPEENSMFRNYMKIKNKLEVEPRATSVGPKLGLVSRE